MVANLVSGANECFSIWTYSRHHGSLLTYGLFKLFGCPLARYNYDSLTSLIKRIRSHVFLDIVKLIRFTESLTLGS